MADVGNLSPVSICSSVISQSPDRRGGEGRRNRLAAGSRAVVENGDFLRREKHDLVFGQPKRAELRLRQLHADGRRPIRHSLDLDEWPRGIDVLDDGTEMASAVGLARDLEQVRPDENRLAGGLIVKIHLPAVDAAGKKSYVAE